MRRRRQRVQQARCHRLSEGYFDVEVVSTQPRDVTPLTDKGLGLAGSAGTV